MKSKFVIILFLFSFGLAIAYEGNGEQLDCDTKNLYKAEQTKLTFYGDSRMDYVDRDFPYGNQKMHEIINRTLDGTPYLPEELLKEKDIQNFGQDGATTTSILNHLEPPSGCLGKETYKIGNRFVYHAGGNNFIFPFLGTPVNKHIPVTAFGFLYVFSLAKASSEIEQTVALLKMGNASVTNAGKFDILLVGGYRTQEGKSDYNKNQHEFYTNPLNFVSLGLYLLEGAYQQIALRQNVHFVSVWDSMSDYNRFTTLDPIHPNEAGFTQWGKLVGKKLREINFHTEIQKPQDSIPIQTGNRWTDIENSLRYTQIILQRKLAELEIKRKELLEREKKLLEIQERIREAEYKLTLIKQRIEKLDFEIAETKNKIADLDVQIADAQREGKLELAAKLAEAKRIEDARLAELARQKAVADQERIAKEQELALIEAQRVEAEHQAYLARQAFEAAETAARAAQLTRDAELYAAEQARKHEEFMLQLALCVFFRICR